MSQLRVSVGREQWHFEPSDAPIRIGRSSEADVRVTDPAVSREHLEINHGEVGWELRDLSSQGTYSSAGDRIDQIALHDELALQLGGEDGPKLVLEVGELAGTSGVTMMLGDIDVGSTAQLGETALRLELDGEELVLPAHGVVSLGRARDSTVVLGEQHSLVSRHHLKFSWIDDHWWVEDVGSSRGSFIDGRRLEGRQSADGVFHVVLGDSEAGTRIRVATAGSHKKPRRLAPIVVGAAVAVALVASLAAVLLSDGGDGGGANSAAQQAAAREATVMVELLDADLNRMGFRGSGVLVSADGLILTNAHVAYPTTHSERIGLPSEFPDAPLFAVGFASEDGGEVDRFYVAEPVTLHPFHDAAILQIVADGNNDPDFDILFDPLPIGAVDDLRAGDVVDQLGFPSVAATLRVSVTTRNFQSLAPCPGTPGDDCLADLDDGWINLSGQPLGGGSSGGPIVRDGKLIAINQGAVFQAGREVEQNRAVPINLIADELLG